MAESYEERLEAFKRFAERTLEDHRLPHIGEFYKRCVEEDNPVFAAAHELTECTFYRAPRVTSLDNLDIAMLGLPMDVSAPYHGGQKFAPNALREASYTHGPIHERWHTFPLTSVGWAILAM